MPPTMKTLRNCSAAILTVLALAAIATAQETPSEKTAAVKIKNFGQMDERFYRGAQPKDEQDYKALAALGVKTIVDLTAEPKPYEQSLAEASGMTYLHIPMVDKKYPTDEAVRTFLRFASDPKTGKFFVHCAGGRHRTGAIGAVYRYQFYDWTFDQAYAEMKKYDFYTTWGHGAFKDFAQDYFFKIRAIKAAHTTPQTGAP
jgi:tyrosine-protein phosphatase SIW14